MSIIATDIVFVDMTVAHEDLLPGDRLMEGRDGSWGDDESVVVSVEPLNGRPELVELAETVMEGQHIAYYRVDRKEAQMIQRPVAAAHIIPVLIGAAA